MQNCGAAAKNVDGRRMGAFYADGLWKNLGWALAGLCYGSI